MMPEIDKHNMRYVAVTVFPLNFWYVQKIVFFGWFVEQMREALCLAFHHAEGLKNTASEVCRASSHPLRWHGAVTAFLQQAPVALAASAFSQDASATRQLSSLRSDFGSPVRHHGGPATHQQDRDSAVQRYLPVLAGPLAVPRPVYPTPIPQTGEYPVRPSACQLARSIARSTLSSAQTADYPHLRSGFGGPDRLRQTAICSRRVQPQETRPTFLPPARLLRGSFARVLAWLPAARQCGDGHRRGGLRPTLFGESAFLHRWVSGPGPGRFWVLRQTARGIPRYTRLWLHRGGQAIRPYQEERPQLRIPEVALGMGGGRVLLSAPPLEAPAPLCSSPSSHSPGPGRSRATDAFQGQQIRLPRSGDQSPSPSLASVEVLRSARHDREERSRTALRLPLGKNPDRRLGRQRGLLSVVVVRLQPRALVQAAVLAQRLSLRDPRHDSHRFSGLACQAGKEGQSKPVGAAPRLSLRGRVQGSPQENRQIADTSIFVNLHVPMSMVCSVFKALAPESLTFAHF